jgi:hypothetical protein
LWTFLSHDGISAITEPFYELFFPMMEFRLSRSPFANFSFSRWNYGYRSPFANFSFSRWNFGYHRAFPQTFLTIEFQKTHGLGENSFHIYHREYLHRIRLIKNLAPWF